MKKEFKLDCYNADLIGSKILIIGEAPEYATYVSIRLAGDKGCLFIEDKDLEMFAVNILTALGSKRLKRK